MTRWSCAAHLTTMAAVCLVLALPTGSRAAQGEIQPLPPDGTAYGLKLSDWTMAYLQWFVSIPASASPILRLDATGERNGVGQRAPVWFVPPYPVGSSGTRTITVPEGQAILLAPAITLSSDLSGSSREDELLAVDTTYLDQIQELEVSMDGVKVPDVKPYRVKTPLFSIALAPDNLFGLPVTPGKDARLAAATTGYVFLYPPLPLGKHVLAIRQVGPDYKSEWIFNLVVQKPNEPLP